MNATTAWLLLGVVGAVLILNARRPPSPPPPSAVLPYTRVSPTHAAQAADTLGAFDRDYQRTFVTSEVAKDPEGVVRRLFAHRAATLRALNETRFRLPNDLDMERRLAAAIEAVDRDMLERIEDARQRCGMDLLHPGPVDDAWYGAWYRASNDVVT